MMILTVMLLLLQLVLFLSVTFGFGHCGGSGGSAVDVVFVQALSSSSFTSSPRSSSRKRIIPTSKSSKSSRISSSTSSVTEIPVLEGDWYNTTSYEFVSKNYWGRRPVLLKGAFLSECSSSSSSSSTGTIDTDTKVLPPVFPTAEELIELAVVVTEGGDDHDGENTGADRDVEIETYDDTDSDGDDLDQDAYFQDDLQEDFDGDHVDDHPVSRVISCIPGDLSSYEIEFGPFYDTMKTNEEESTTTTTIATSAVVDGFIRRRLLRDSKSKTATSIDPEAAKRRVSTLVVNDVDRFIPHLSDWMDVQFGFRREEYEDEDEDGGEGDREDQRQGRRRFQLDRWRRDDLQVSVTFEEGGGIGPHVDHYDVFLIQASGQRSWDVAIDSKLSVKDEYQLLVPDSEVSILDLSKGSSDDTTGANSDNKQNVNTNSLNIPPLTTVQLEQGDCLYVPARFIHSGTTTISQTGSLTDDKGDGDDSIPNIPVPSITLSVGCRGPSAGDLLTKIAETIRTSTTEKATMRYTENDDADDNRIGDGDGDGDGDDDGHDDIERSSLSHPNVRQRMKSLIMDALDELWEDEETWDELIGGFVTEPKRIGGSTSNSDDGEDDAGSIIAAIRQQQEQQKQQDDQSTILLRRAEGVAFGWSYVGKSTSTSSSSWRIYASGQKFQVDKVDLLSDLSVSEGLEDATDVAIAAIHKDMSRIMDRIANGPPINKSFLDNLSHRSILECISFQTFLQELLHEGFIYVDSNSDNGVL